MPVRAGVGPVVDVAASQQAVVLAVGDDQLAQRLCALHGLAHQPAVLYAVPVVGKGDHPVGKSLQIGDFLSPFAHGDGGIGIDGDTGVPLDDLALAAQVFRTVRHGIEVRHGAHGGIAAAGGGPAAGGDRFLIRKTRLAKVHMHVAKTGQKDILTCVQADKGRIVIPDKRRAHLVVDSSDLVEHGHSQILPNKKTLPVRQGMEEERLFPMQFALPISLGRLKVVLIITGYLFVCQSAKCTEIRYFPAMDICFSGTCSKRVCKVGKTGRQVKTAPLRADCGKRGRALSFQDSCGEAAV